MRGATSLVDSNVVSVVIISIHAPHARSDSGRQSSPHRSSHFNPRSSCEERPKQTRKETPTPKFQSTLLMRGATDSPILSVRRVSHFNPRSSCEERRAATQTPQARLSYFNPRSSCEERRETSYTRPTRAMDFNPRSSCEERRSRCLQRSWFCKISIHAPHARSDKGYHKAAEAGKISIHAPHARSDFLSPPEKTAQDISIHAPHARSDVRSSCLMSLISSFQSTLLMRGATSPILSRHTVTSYFNPRSSCEERRPLTQQAFVLIQISIHAPHARSDLQL